MPLICNGKGSLYQMDSNKVGRDFGGAIALSSQHIRDGAKLLEKGYVHRGYIEFARAYALIRPDKSEKIVRELTNTVPDEPHFHEISNSLKQDVFDMERILSIGESFRDEEVLSILCRRLDVQLLLSLFRECYSKPVDISTQALDYKIARLFSHVTSKRCRKAFLEIYGD